MAKQHDPISLTDMNNLLNLVNQAREKHGLSQVTLNNIEMAKASDMNQIINWLKETANNIYDPKPSVDINSLSTGTIITYNDYSTIYNKATEIYNTPNVYPGKLVKTYTLKMTKIGEAYTKLSTVDTDKIVISGSGYAASSGDMNKPAGVQIISENLDLLYYDVSYSSEYGYCYSDAVSKYVYKIFSSRDTATVYRYENNKLVYDSYIWLDSGEFRDGGLAVINNEPYFFILTSYNDQYISVVKNNVCITNSRQTPNYIFSLGGAKTTDSNYIAAVSEYGTYLDSSGTVVNTRLTDLSSGNDFVCFYGYKKGWLVNHQVRLNTQSHFPDEDIIITKGNLRFYFNDDYIDDYHLEENRFIYIHYGYSRLTSTLTYYQLNDDGTKTLILEIEDAYLEDFLVFNDYLYVLYCKRDQDGIPSGRLEKYKL